MNFYRNLSIKFNKEQSKFRNGEDEEVSLLNRAKRSRLQQDDDDDGGLNDDDDDDDDGIRVMITDSKGGPYHGDDNDAFYHDDALGNYNYDDNNKYESETMNYDESEKLWFVEESERESESDSDSDMVGSDNHSDDDEYQYQALYDDFNITQHVIGEIEKRYYAMKRKIEDNPALFHANNKSCNLTTTEAHTLINNYIATESLKYISINSLLVLLGKLLPGANLPKKLTMAYDSFSFDEESQCIFKFHCCPCGKTVYVGANKHATTCVDPNCDYKNRFTEVIRKRTPLRELNYRSLALLICELLHTKFFLKAISCKNSNSTEGILVDILDGDAAKRHLKEMHVRFEKKKEQMKTANKVVEVSLLFSIYYDGAQLFKKSTTSIWPLMLSILNLPPPLRKARGKGLFMLSLFTAKSGSNCEAFIMENLVNELKFLYRGFTIAIDGTVYVIQARLIMHCYDSRALESVVKVQGSGSYAGCPLCGLCEG